MFNLAPLRCKILRTSTWPIDAAAWAGVSWFCDIKVCYVVKHDVKNIVERPCTKNTSQLLLCLQRCHYVRQCTGSHMITSAISILHRRPCDTHDIYMHTQGSFHWPTKYTNKILMSLTFHNITVHEKLAWARDSKPICRDGLKTRWRLQSLVLAFTRWYHCRGSNAHI